LQYIFEWDPRKAKENLRNHRIGFERGATIFRDPQALSIFDVAHSHEEDRWITLGLEQGGSLLVVVHTFHQIDESSRRIRIISARRATAREIRQDQGGQT
jgi:uncharacterized DUF497 family protein